ncbi:MAG: hypothetical protein KDD42_00225 [Bdellovibrionales bacterium]|nr:hypothetical protein [Bdellovibrionales bacterium]
MTREPMKFIPHLIFLLVALFLVGCNSSEEESQAQSLSNEFERLVEKMARKFDELTPSSSDVHKLTTAEVEKLFTYEYKTLELSADAGPKEIETKLAELGADRWDCFYAERVNKALLFYCKRRPKTYLRYIPRVF